MKKNTCTAFILSTFLFCLTFTPGLGAQEASDFTYFGHLGLAVSDFKGLYFDIGLEKAFNDKLSGQAFLDYYLNPVDLSDLYENFSTSAYGVGVYGKYNITNTDKLGIYLRGGLHLTFLAMNYNWFGEDIELSSEAKFGLGGGAGVEYTLTDSLKLLLDGSIRTLFGDGSLTFFTISAGVRTSL